MFKPERNPALTSCSYAPLVATTFPGDSILAAAIVFANASVVFSHLLNGPPSTTITSAPISIDFSKPVITSMI